MDTETLANIKAIKTLLETTRGFVSNVHDQHYYLTEALNAMNNACQPCTCEFCIPDAKHPQNQKTSD